MKRSRKSVKRPNKSVFFVFIGLALDALILFCYYVGMTYEAPRHKAMKNPINAWGAEWPKHRKPQRPLRLQHLRQERQAHQWRIHRPRGGQAVDGGAGEKGGIKSGFFGGAEPMNRGKSRWKWRSKPTNFLA